MATEEQLTPDERAIFAELEKLRGVSDKKLFHDFCGGDPRSQFQSAGRKARPLLQPDEVRPFACSRLILDGIRPFFLSSLKHSALSMDQSLRTQFTGRI